jgi:hypothetical protein
MATMVLPLRELEIAERKALTILSGLSRAPGQGRVRHMWLVFSLALDFQGIVRSTDRLLRGLEDPKIQTLSEEQLLELATKLDASVALRMAALSKTRSLGISSLETYLGRIERQCERFDSMAETFRLAADRGMQTRMRTLVDSARREATDSTKTDWRDLAQYCSGQF